MSSTSEPMHLCNHHHNTRRQIFQHPVSHNIEWRAVVSLLEAVGSVEKHPAALTSASLVCQDSIARARITAGMRASVTPRVDHAP